MSTFLIITADENHHRRDSGSLPSDHYLVTSTLVLNADVDLDDDGDVVGADFLAIQRTNPALIPDWQRREGF